jgi:Matrixin
MKARRTALLLMAVAVSVGGGDVGHAYLRSFLDLDGERIFVRWLEPTIRYVVNDRGVSGVSGAELQTVVDRAFARWRDVPTSAISFQSAGVTTASPLDQDFINTIGFINAPEFEGVLGLTTVTFDTVTGEIVEADIFFNSTELWSVAAQGQAGRFDLESVATHEAGHFLGLDHSALGFFEEKDGDVRLASAEAIMFPYAFDAGNIALRTLRPDDIAGASFIYPDGDFSATTGTLSGRVIRGTAGAYGAHVMALNPITGRMIGGFVLGSAGEFAIAGLEPGQYVVRVEPIDDIGIDSFFEEPPTVELDFAPRFYDRFVTVPAGGVSERFDIQVEVSRK